MMLTPASVSRNSRRGAALPLALGAMVVIGVLLVSSFFGASQQTKIGAAAVDQVHASAASDNGLNAAMMSLAGASLDSLEIGEHTTPVILTGADGDRARVYLTRLQKNVYMIVSTGEAKSGNAASAAQRRTGMLFRMKMVADSADTTFVAVRIAERGWMQLW